MSYREPEGLTNYPRLAFLHHQGWEVYACAPRRFRLWSPEHGTIAAFTSLERAIAYMNLEFL